MDIKNVGLSSNSSNVTTENRGLSGVNNHNMSVANNAGNSTLANMTKGSVFAGDIIDVRSTAIKILLSNNETVQAKASNSTELNIGDHINFKVEDNNGQSIMIKALNVNNRYTSPLTMALESANIPVTERNMQMINAMMHNEMPIDKTSVYNMYKTASAFEEFDVNNIVDMVRHDIDINETNLTQFEKYVNYEHRISNEVDAIADDVVDMLKTTTAYAKEDTEVVVKSFVNELLDELPESTFVAKDNGALFDFAVGDNNMQNAELQGLNDGVIEESIVNPMSENNLESELQTQIKLLDSLELNSENLEQMLSIAKEHTESTEISDKFMNNIKKTFLEASDSKTVDKDLLKNIINSLDDKKMTELFSSNEFRKYIKKSFSKSFKLDLSEIKTDGEKLKESIKNIYEKMDHKTDKLMEMAKSLSENANKFKNDVTGLKNNLSFMNELNSMASYVQLPLITSGGENHGDLYVFNKNRNKTIKDDEVTAFMHLDMDHLGATDCFVRLTEDNKLSTNFTLSDDLSYKIIEEHLDELKARLDKLGFNVSVSVSHGEKENNPIEIIMEADKPKISIKRYSFDVRA